MRPAALGIAIAALFAALPAPGQDLAAAAAREKERREKAGKKSQAFTNDDLSKGAPPKPSPSPGTTASDGRPMDSDRLRRLGGGGSAASAPSAPSGSGAAQPSKPAQCVGACEEGAGSSGSGDEAGWRGRAQAMRDGIARAEADVARVQKALEGVRAGQVQPLPIDAMRQVPPNPLTPPADAERLTKELETAKAALAAARKAQADFEEEARRAGVPPGWLR
jgi:hypothetical protein